MHHRRRTLLTALGAAALILPVFSSARAEADTCAADPAPAKCYLAAAGTLRDSNPHDAAALYLKSYRLDPKIDPLAGYGFALALDKQYVDAAEVLQKAVEEYEKLRTQMEASNADANTLFQVIHRVEFVKDEITKLVPNLGKVQLKVIDKKMPPGITVVRKGGNELHGSDMTVLFVNPNTDTLVFTYPSGKTGELEVHVPAGTISTVEVPPEPKAPPPPPPPPKPPVDPSLTTRRNAYIAGGAGGVVLIGGVVYVVADSKASAGLTAGIIGLGLAGVGLGVYLYYLADKKHDAFVADHPSTPTIVPVVDQDSIGAVLLGTF